MFREITKDWNIKYFYTNDNKDDNDPPSIDTLPGNNLDDVVGGKSDMGLCSIWLHFGHAKEFDLTTYLNNECTTLLLPRPRLLNVGGSLYLTLHPSVWIIFVSCFLLTSALLTLLSNIGISQMEKPKSKQAYRHWARSIFEVLNATTSHSARMSLQASVNVLVLR